ncbi:hypothetical protein JXA34_00500 [Patescibacteria group bacterium]|nr:hypothetical protein [Patescibacteria group bacterium]
MVTLAALVIIPRIPVSVDTRFLKLDSSIGGYQLNLFGGRVSRDLSVFSKGFDFKGSTKILLSVDADDGDQQKGSSKIDECIDVMTHRLNLLGVSEYILSKETIGDRDFISLVVPTTDSPENVVSTLTDSAKVIFRQLNPELEWSKEKFTDYFYNIDVWEDSDVNQRDLYGIDLIDPHTKTYEEGNPPRLRIRFTDEGRNKFIQLAKENVNRPLALFVGNIPFPISMPEVSQEFANGLTGDPVISGNINIPTAKVLSMQLESGELPLATSIYKTEDIEPKMPPLLIKSNLFVGLFAFGALTFYFLVKYGRPGLVGLICFTSFIITYLALFKLVPIRLSIASISGMSLASIYCIYLLFMVLGSLSQELMQDKPRNLAERNAFKRVWSSVISSGTFILLFSALMYSPGDLPSREMILALVVGSVTSIFIVFYMFRVLLDTLGWYRSTK